MSIKESITLVNGAKMPLLGLGTWQVLSPDECKAAVRAALDAGYRHIDTAFFYGNEAFIGEVLQEYFSSGKLTREEIFITTKLSVTLHHKDQVTVSLDESLKKLQLAYVDLFLIHLPTPIKVDPADPSKMTNDEVKLEDTWMGMEQQVRNGKAKSIGVSNFNKRQLERILSIAEIKPVTNQIECHLYFQQTKLSSFMEEKGIIMTAYSPLGSPDRPADCKRADDPKDLDDVIAKELAEKYKKSIAQVLLRFLIQKRIPVIPKSTNAGRIKSNSEIFDFQLTDDEVSRLVAQDKNRRLITCDMFGTHPEYPFSDEF